MLNLVISAFHFFCIKVKHLCYLLPPNGKPLGRYMTFQQRSKSSGTSKSFHVSQSKWPSHSFKVGCGFFPEIFLGVYFVFHYPEGVRYGAVVEAAKMPADVGVGDLGEMEHGERHRHLAGNNITGLPS